VVEIVTAPPVAPTFLSPPDDRVDPDDLILSDLPIS
jgi:hypothetical protein